MAKRHSNFKDLTGQVFGDWKVERRTEDNSYNGVYWLCICICGQQRKVLAKNLTNGRSKSCGCRKTYRQRLHMKVQGMSATKKREYTIWYNMIQRCYNHTHKNYHQYGGRGITVCYRWHSFFNFLLDIGEKPSRELSLERIDNNNNYFKENCKWATRREQARNRRTNRLLTFNGQTKTLIEWAEVTNLPPYMIRNRLNRDWTIAHALTTPVRLLLKKK